MELYLPPHWGIICSTETQSTPSASHWLLRNSSFLWTSSSHTTNPAILHLHYVLRLQLRAESLVLKQFYQPEVLWAWIKIQMNAWIKLMAASPTQRAFSENPEEIAIWALPISVYVAREDGWSYNNNSFSQGVIILLFHYCKWCSSLYHFVNPRLQTKLFWTRTYCWLRWRGLLFSSLIELSYLRQTLLIKKKKIIF